MACKCQVCNQIVDGFNGQMVMLRNDLWKSIKSSYNILCVDCIEFILERSIQSSDLKFITFNGKVCWIPVNYLFIRSREVGLSCAEDELRQLIKTKDRYINLSDYNPDSVTSVAIGRRV